MPHVPDDDRVRLAHRPRARQQPDPGGAELEAEDGHEPGSLQDANAPGRVQRQGDVALLHVVAECGESLLQDPDAGDCLRVICTEEQGLASRSVG